MQRNNDTEQRDFRQSVHNISNVTNSYSAAVNAGFCVFVSSLVLIETERVN